MASLQFRVDGIPAPFATRREQEWKQILEKQVPPPSLDGREAGIILRFVLPTLAPRGQALDVDNLCEPVFSVVVNRIGWFGGRRPNIRFWSAQKVAADHPRCEITMLTEASPGAPQVEPSIDAIYRGNLPSSAKAPEVARWAATLLPDALSRQANPLEIALEFGSDSINLGNIATGPIKSFIDCLYPILGGIPGAPDDHRIGRISASKGHDNLASDAIRVRVWGALSVSRLGTPTGSVRRASIASPQSLVNPCRPGSRKHLVCQAALDERTLSDLESLLEQLAKGSSKKIREYVADLRSENRLDVRIVGRRITCRGRL